MKKIPAAPPSRKKVFLLSTAVMLTALTLFTGCHKRVSTRPQEAPPPPPSVSQQSETAQQPKAPEKISEKKVEAVTSSDVSQTPAYTESKEGKGMFADIMFEFDKYDVKDSYKSELEAVSQWMMKNASAKLSIEGNCDERGTNEYNLALGDRRAKAVKDYLVSLGVISSRIETISYGEEKPVCTEHTEECWAKNRRAHFVILTKAGKQ